jgi:periplasmic protein CpxP/Spy
MKMKTRFCAFALSTIFGLGLAMAAPQDQNNNGNDQQQQGMRRQAPSPDREVKRLAKRLNLTDDQQKQLLPIFTDRQQQFESIRNDNSLTQDQRRTKMRSLREETDTKVKAVLTDSQKQSYEQMQQQAREHMRERMSQQGSGDNSSASTPQK